MSDRWEILKGDCRAMLRFLPDASVDACVCDPPYELGFMGKAWDASGVAFDPATWREVLRVLKPGGHLLAFGGSRTYHRIACAIEDAGFEVRDSLHWIYGTGFPKYKQLDGKDVTTALKPAHEPIVLARKPVEGTTTANYHEHGTGGLQTGLTRVGVAGGGTHCSNRDAQGKCLGHDNAGRSTSGETFHGAETEGDGRWPPNVLLTHADGCEVIGTRTETRPIMKHIDGEQNGFGLTPGAASSVGTFEQQAEVWSCVPGCAVAELDAQSGITTAGAPTEARGTRPGGFADVGAAGGSSVPNGPQHGDTGGASRFFPCFRFVSKPGNAERDRGLDAFPRATRGELCDREEDSAGANNPRAGTRAKTGRANIHPTVKPVDLMRWLVRLVTPPGGIVLDPFVGSGTTGVAAMLEGATFIGCELDEAGTYLPIAVARVQHAIDHPEAYAPRVTKAKGKPRRSGRHFGEAMKAKDGEP